VLAFFNLLMVEIVGRLAVVFLAMIGTLYFASSKEEARQADLRKPQGRRSAP